MKLSRPTGMISEVELQAASEIAAAAASMMFLNRVVIPFHAAGLIAVR
jgi:hypothetical protein